MFLKNGGVIDNDMLLQKLINDKKNNLHIFFFNEVKSPVVFDSVCKNCVSN